MQRSNGLPLPKDSERSLYKAAAQGCIGAPPGPAARSCSSRLSAARQSPDRSGLPSTAFGAGADKIGLPSGVRGVFGSFTFTHCANAATFIAKTTAISRIVRMCLIIYSPTPYFPTKRYESFSFSQTDSINSLSANNSNGTVAFQGRVYALGSSMVISYSM